MARIWLILADILAAFLLVLSFILFYLYPLENYTSSTTSFSGFEHNNTLDIFGSKRLNLDTAINFNDFIHTNQERVVEEFTIENIYLNRTLEEGLKALSTHIGDKVFIRIFKQESLLEVWMYIDAEYKHLKDYEICAYSGGLGPKLKEGDRQAPEGFYKVKQHHLNPNSKFHLSFNLGYPNRYDRVHKRTGSFLMVHGNCVSVGCYAMTDKKIEEIYTLVEKALKKGQKYVPVHIYPFRMTAENIALYSDNKWYDFWMNLKEGYDYFEAEKLPPVIKVNNKLYNIFEANE